MATKMRKCGERLVVQAYGGGHRYACPTCDRGCFGTLPSLCFTNASPPADHLCAREYEVREPVAPMPTPMPTPLRKKKAAKEDPYRGIGLKDTVRVINETRPSFKRTGTVNTLRNGWVEVSMTEGFEWYKVEEVEKCDER